MSFIKVICKSCMKGYHTVCMKEGCECCPLEVDQKVKYRRRYGQTPEIGTVVRMSPDPTLVFVLYEGDETAKATRITDLEVIE